MTSKFPIPLVAAGQTLGPLHVVVRFGAEIGHDAQADALLEMEKRLRLFTGKDIRVYKDLMGDDSKLRRAMTPEQRAKL